jgi:group II intron reverse transcriptase/maturase
MKKRVNWVLDADIRGFFDTIDHEWLMKFVEHRIADRHVLRHIKKWLHAGVLESGEWRKVQEGTPQGGSISPLLANIYLHYVLDLWAHLMRTTELHGEMIIVRYADDFVMGFESRGDAEWMLEALKARLGRFNLSLHPDKTRLLEFGRFAEASRARRGEGRPETFDFLGFTHYCARSRKGAFLVLRKTARKARQAILRRIREGLRARMHENLHRTGQWLHRVLSGFHRYFAVPGNLRSLTSLSHEVMLRWRQVIRRRSQRCDARWCRMTRLRSRHLPAPRILHPWPTARLRV